MTTVKNEAYHLPSINWEKQDLVLRTNSGVLHYPVDEKRLSKYYRTINQGYTVCCYYIEDKGDYLSLRLYDINSYGLFYRVCNYKKTVADHKPPRFVQTKRFDIRFTTARDSEGRVTTVMKNVYPEIRFYKDGTYAVVYHVPIGKTIHSYAMSNFAIYDSDGGIPQIINADKSDVYCELHPRYIDQCIKNAWDSCKICKEVYTDEEIKSIAARPTEASAKRLKTSLYLDSRVDILAKNIQSDVTSAWYGCRGFTPETYCIVNGFFDVMSDDNAGKRELYRRKFGGSEIKSLYNLTDILNWCKLATTARASLSSKQSLAEYLIKPVYKLWEKEPVPVTKTKDDEKVDKVDSFTYDNTAYWYRVEDYICMITPNRSPLLTRGSSWKISAKTKILFAYNVKTKKRFYALYSPDVKDWTFPVPALNTLTNDLYLGSYTDCSSDGKTILSSCAMKTKILGGLSVRELFDKSNIAWILDNVSDENPINIYERDKRFSNTRYTKTACCPTSDTTKRLPEEYAPVDIRDSLRDDHIGSIAISILATSGIPIVEQALKSKLFNFYLYLLYDLESRDGNTVHHVADLDKKSDSLYHYDYLTDNSFIYYHSKGKNLKEMFGYSMRVMRLIDKSVAITKYAYQDGEEAWLQLMPNISKLTLLYGGLNDIDDTTIEGIFKFSQDIWILDSHGWSWRGCSQFERHAATLGHHLTKYTPKQILEICRTYCLTKEIEDDGKELFFDSTQLYVDYLNMREKLQNIQKERPDTLGIFSESKYPIRPKDSRRFIAYVDGMTAASSASHLPWRYRSGRHFGRPSDSSISRDVLHQDYAQLYPRAEKRNDIITIYDEKGVVSGLTILLDPSDHVRYLHNEASFWCSMYNSSDSSKEKEFADAVQRVKKYEWKSESHGLEIVAPKDIADLCNEGAVLDHCVASYVDPIINGGEDIMFLRRSDMPDDPFFTVEILKDKTIGQVHCYYNEELSKEGQQRAFAMSGLPVYDKFFDVFDFLIDWCHHTGLKEFSVIEKYADVH